MPSSRRALVLTPVALAVATLLGPGAAAIAVAAPASAVPAPRAGLWNLTQTFNETHGGSFTVTSGLKEKGLTTRVGSASTQYCGSGTVHVVGRHDIHLVGSGAARAYIVGKRLDNTQSFGVKPIAVQVSFHQKRYDATLGIKFEDRHSGEGQINFNPVAGLQCDLAFSVHKAA